MTWRAGAGRGVSRTRTLVSLLCAACSLAAPRGLGAQAAGTELPAAVSVEWLTRALGTPQLVVLQLGTAASFDSAHVPGAARLDFEAAVAAPAVNGGLRLELPDPRVLEAALRAAGVSDDSRVVLVFDIPQAFTRAGRTFFTLEWAGLRGRVAVLDGGLPAWRRADQPVESGEGRSRDAGDLRVAPVPALVASRDAVLAGAQGLGRRLIDARTFEFFDDTRDNGMPRGGHIASAVSLPFNSVVDASGLLKPPADIARLLEGAGIRAGEALTTYCHIGLQASWAYFALRTLGRDVTLYDGSFDEWSRDASLPIEGARARP